MRENRWRVRQEDVNLAYDLGRIFYHLRTVRRRLGSPGRAGSRRYRPQSERFASSEIPFDECLKERASLLLPLFTGVRGRGPTASLSSGSLGQAQYNGMSKARVGRADGRSRRTRYLRSMNSMRYPSGSRTKKIRLPLPMACGLLSKSTPPAPSSRSARASRSSTAKATWL